MKLPRLTSRGAFEEPPPDDTIALVTVRLSSWGPAWEALAAERLSRDEQERAARFVHLDDLRRHVLGRLLIRTGAARWLDASPEEIEIQTGPHDKPELPGSRPRFNVSHGGDVVAAAFADGFPVGVDLEPAERKDGVDGLAERVLTDREFERWKSVPGSRRSRFFMHVWTAKESLIKATGEGLHRDPTTIECHFDGHTVVGFRRLDPVDNAVDSGEAADWSVQPFALGGDTVGAAAHPSAVEPDLTRYIPTWATQRDT